MLGFRVISALRTQKNRHCVYSSRTNRLVHMGYLIVVHLDPRLLVLRFLGLGINPKPYRSAEPTFFEAQLEFRRPVSLNVQNIP